MKVVNKGLKIIERIRGIRCRKASTYASIIAASRVLYEEFKISFKVEKNTLHLL